MYIDLSGLHWLNAVVLAVQSLFILWKGIVHDIDWDLLCEFQ